MADPSGRPERVHPSAQAFGGVAGLYDRSRPEYPVEAVEAIRSRLGLDEGSIIVDLAAGTGKLTRALISAFGARVIAVEPSEGMRREFVRQVPMAPVLDGTAESIPLSDGSILAVVVGQAFHWFKAEAAVHEMARVLRPDGGVALIWNLRDERVPWVARFGEIIRSPEREPTPSSKDRAWKEAFEKVAKFEPIQREEFHTAQSLTAEGLVERALSVSFVARLPDEAKRRVVAEVQELARTDPSLQGHDRIELPYVTELYWALRRRSDAAASSA